MRLQDRMSDAPPTAAPAPSHGDVAGRPVVLAYTTAADEYAALHRHAVIVDRSQRGRVRVSGPRAAEMVSGLVTNDTTALQPGHGQYAAALSPRGKIVADVRIFVDGEGVLTDTPPRAADAWLGMLRKYVNPRLAPYRDESQALRCVGVFGPRARDVMEHATGIGASALGLLPMYAHVQVQDGDDALLVARTPELAVDGFEVFASPAACDRLWARAVAAHAVPCGLTAWDIARVEAGRPEWGVDMDDTTIPQEANFDELQAISYTKGCYVGQEVVARLHFRGHTNRNLRGLRAAGSAPPPAGATLVDPAGKAVGDVRSAVSSPRLGGIALAMIRREVEMGTTLTAAWDGGEMHVDVVPLPFPTE